jgi:hypothetical protein
MVRYVIYHKPFSALYILNKPSPLKVGLVAPCTIELIGIRTLPIRGFFIAIAEVD